MHFLPLLLEYIFLKSLTYERSLYYTSFNRLIKCKGTVSFSVINLQQGLTKGGKTFLLTYLSFPRIVPGTFVVLDVRCVTSTLRQCENT